MLKKDNFNSLWAQCLKYVNDIYAADMISLLNTFGNDTVTLKLQSARLHHTAVYIGDYSDEAVVDDFYCFLENKIGKEIKFLQRGPSYISAMRYGTPGWWFTIDTNDGLHFELFCCRNFGRWKDLSQKVKSSLMSHHAVEMDSIDMMNKYISEIEKIPNMVNIAFTKRDEIGHTYVHFRNAINNKILELICVS